MKLTAQVAERRGRGCGELPMSVGSNCRLQHGPWAVEMAAGQRNRSLRHSKEVCMSSHAVGGSSHAEPSADRAETMGSAEGGGWLVFASIMITIAGALNIIWGIAAISNSKFFTQNATYVLSDLNTWGWILLIIGALQLCAAVSIVTGGQYGRWFGIVAAGANSIAALMSISAYPFWALCLFGVDILIIYGLAAYGGQRKDII
jgi:hypothetical protein